MVVLGSNRQLYSPDFSRHSWLQLQPGYRTVNTARQHQVYFFCGVLITVKSLFFRALKDSSGAMKETRIVGMKVRLYCPVTDMTISLILYALLKM